MSNVPASPAKSSLFAALQILVNLLRSVQIGGGNVFVCLLVSRLLRKLSVYFHGVKSIRQATD